MTITPYEAPAGGLDFYVWVPGEGDVPFYHLPPGAPVPSARTVALALAVEVLECSDRLQLMMHGTPRATWFAVAPGLEADVAAALTKVRP